MIERITEEEERASEAIANLAGRNGINFKPLSPSNDDIRTLEHEGLFFNHFKNFRKIRNFQKNSENSDFHFEKRAKAPHIFIPSIFSNHFNVGCTKWDFSISLVKTNRNFYENSTRDKNHVITIS